MPHSRHTVGATLVVALCTGAATMGQPPGLPLHCFDNGLSCHSGQGVELCSLYLAFYKPESITAACMFHVNDALRNGPVTVYGRGDPGGRPPYRRSDPGATTRVAPTLLRQRSLMPFRARRRTVFAESGVSQVTGNAAALPTPAGLEARTPAATSLTHVPTPPMVAAAHGAKQHTASHTLNPARSDDYPRQAS